MPNYQLMALDFRNKIEKAKANGKFSIKDRMSGFPVGCCDDSSDLFAHHLWITMKKESIRVDGSYYADNIEDNIWHTWLEVDGIIIDLTADQFPKYKGAYIGPLDKFHSKFSVEKEKYRGFLDYSDSCWDRMKKCYDAIVDTY